MELLPDTLQEASVIAATLTPSSDAEEVVRQINMLNADFNDYSFKVAYNMRQRELALAELTKLKEARSKLEEPAEVDNDEAEVESS